MDKNAATLINGGIGVVATDTIYGIVGRALNQATVERIYVVKRRTPTKPFIILIADIGDITQFGITLDDHTKAILEKYWPGPVSIILECDNPDLAYLHRGTKSLAFRMPEKTELQTLLQQTGPLVAPSANPEGLEPATTITEAKSYFGDTVDFYQEGIVTGRASKIIRITDGGEEIIRA